MAADPREAVLLGGYAVTGITSAADQSIVTGGFASGIIQILALAFGAARRRFRFAGAKR